MKTNDFDQHSQSVSASALQVETAGQDPPITIDVRRDEVFRKATEMLSGALRRDPDSVTSWAQSLPPAGSFVVYCAHGREVSQHAATALRERDMAVRYLEGGIAAWSAARGAMDAKPRGAAGTRWVTRERPKIDRIACPWLVARFVDAEADFLYVPTSQVLRAARESEAVPYDIPDVHFSHEGERCSFDAFLKHYRLRDPALAQLALIVRGADTARLDLAPQAPGLAAISLGLSRNFADDQEMLAHGMVMYGALYRWCKEGQDEVHTWNPHLYRTAKAAVA